MSSLTIKFLALITVEIKTRQTSGFDSSISEMFSFFKSEVLRIDKNSIWFEVKSTGYLTEKD